MIQKDISRCLLFATCLFLFETSIAEVHYNGLDRYGFKVCEDDKSRQISYSRKVSTIGYVSYKTKCGFMGWRRCTRSRKVTKYKLQRAYRTIWDVYVRCCRGWTKKYYSSRDCRMAICDSGCNNGGRCESPNTCNCKSGWTGYTCSQDVDECKDTSICRCSMNVPNNPCNAKCTNSPGSFSCSCGNGYYLRYKTVCTDVDECKDTSICRCSMNVPNNACNAKCTNIPGSFRCSCGNGYYLPYKTVCTDFNECSSNNGGCSHFCRNVLGSYHCGCPRGFRLDSNLKLCIDVNECEDNNGNCQHICHNVHGKHRCSCRQGFVLDGNKRTCSDINECVLDEDDCDQSCENIGGAYRCYCRNGYHLSSDGRTCKANKNL